MEGTGRGNHCKKVSTTDFFAHPSEIKGLDIFKSKSIVKKTMDSLSNRNQDIPEPIATGHICTVPKTVGRRNPPGVFKTALVFL